MADAADQAETLARAICAAEDRDPDALVRSPAGAAPDTPAGDVPQWRLYEPHARRMIAAQDGLNAPEGPGRS